MTEEAPTIAGLIKINNGLGRRISELEAKVAELKSQLISGFYANEIPVYSQGEPTHELQELLTAKEANGMVDRITKLREGLKKLRGFIPVIERGLSGKLMDECIDALLNGGK